MTSWCWRSPPASAMPSRTVVRQEMGAAYPLDVPLDVSVGLGVNWHDAAH